MNSLHEQIRHQLQKSIEHDRPMIDNQHHIDFNDLLYKLRDILKDKDEQINQLQKFLYELMQYKELEDLQYINNTMQNIQNKE